MEFVLVSVLATISAVASQQLQSYIPQQSQQYYSCNGRLYSYPYQGCTYNNFQQNPFNNNNGVFYSCNGFLYSYPNPGCTYNTGIAAAGTVGTAVFGVSTAGVVANINPVVNGGLPQIAPVGTAVGAILPTGQLGPLPG
ncbi:hypothetical protein BV898_16664 [Hypsibius exemplaris]|uniref:Chitin-binding type-2 domain-containing protein n=1 Tax=Hypsibius exemplaris TaxID=2072580 RepID=A0A9X6RM21_HYPEX|nr:hypothetical protein BV898_16664 [Hypsibius exemplaris]